MTDDTIAAALERLRRDNYTHDFGGREARQADLDRIELAVTPASAPEVPPRVQAPACTCHSGNTTLMKEFAAGFLVITGANSSSGLRSMSVRFLGMDEIDEYEADLNDQGSAPVGMETWLPMDTAPRDGSMVRLLVDFDDHATEDPERPSATIGANYFDHDGEDRWQFAGWCWTHDHFTEGKGTPVGWLPMLAEGPQQPAAVDEAMVDRAWAAYCDNDGTAREGIRAALTAALASRQGETADA